MTTTKLRRFGSAFRVWLRGSHFSPKDVVLIALVGCCLLFTAHMVNAEGHKFCDIVHTATAHAVPKPSNPEANPSREQSYVFYSEFVTLGGRLGCTVKGK